MKLQQVVRRETLLIVPLILGAAGAVSAAYGQFTSGVSLVEVYATVTDRHGELVTGLTADDFHVTEDGSPQAITAFAAGEFPLAVGVGVDRSFSMGGRSDRLAVAKAAARTFVRDLRPGDQVMVMAIGSETSVVAPLSADHDQAVAAINALDAWGTTPLYDATLAAIEAIQLAKGRRALVLLSDGTDRYSESSAADLVQQARRRDVLVYPIALGRSRPPVFAELSAATGGRSFFANDPRQIGSALAAIARELRFQYLLGYVPSRRDDGAWHSIEVSVTRADAKVRAREGYFSR